MKAKQPTCECKTEGRPTDLCGKPAVAAYDWPSCGLLDVPVSACEDHLAWAEAVAKALGFALRFERYVTPAPPGRRKITL